MNQTPTPTLKGPFRVLLLDRSDPDDARWIIATVLMSSDILAAEIGPEGDYLDWPAATVFVREQVGRLDVQLHPMLSVMAWRIEEPR